MESHEQTSQAAPPRPASAPPTPSAPEGHSTAPAQRGPAGGAARETADHDERDAREAGEESDVVEQASIESFPASDPPGWIPVQI